MDSYDPNIYKFLIKNTTVEWTQLVFKDDRTVIGTTNRKNAERTPVYYYENRTDKIKDLSAFYHNHPGQNINPSNADKIVVAKLEEFAVNLQKLYHYYYGRWYYKSHNL